MKKLFIFLLFLGQASLFSAQTVSVSKHMPIRSNESYEILGKLKGQYLLFKTTLDGSDQVIGFDAELNLKWSKELEYDYKKVTLLNLSATRNDFTLIYQYQTKGRTIIKAHKYDPGANLIDSVTVYNLKSTYGDTEKQVALSEDKSKILIYQIENMSLVKVISFDIENMKVLWNTVFTPADLAFQQDFLQVLASDKGEMYFILGKDNRKNKRENHVYDIYIGNEETAGTSISFFTLPMREKLTYDIIFTYDNLNEMIVAGGLYSEKTKTKSVGYFYLGISPDNPNNYRLVFEPFESDFISTFLGKDVGDKTGLDEAVVQELILRRDGGILLVGEYAVQNDRQTNGAGSLGPGIGHVYYDYYYDDLFVISIHPDGQTHWKTILHKRQYSFDDDAAYSSYFLVKTPSSLRFVFNDEIKYENTVSEYVLNGEGKYDRNSLLNTKNKKLRLAFRRGIQVGASEYIVPSEFRNRLSLVKIKY